MTLSQIMTKAWAIYRDRGGKFSAALKMAWALSRGFSHAFEIVFTDGVRLVRGAYSADEARKGFIASEHAARDRGAKSLGGSSAINLMIYA